MNIDCSMLRIGKLQCPFAAVSGSIPTGSKGNRQVGELFATLSDQLDLLASPARMVIYDLSDCEYRMGDHFAGFFWVLPALLDGVGIQLAAHGSTLEGLRSLAAFVGPWLPIDFYGSKNEICESHAYNSKRIDDLQRKVTECRRLVMDPSDDDRGTAIAIFGSRQTGIRYGTEQSFGEDSDIDYGAVGTPRALARLCSHKPNRDMNVQHPPTKLFMDNDEAVEQGYFVVLPERGSSGQR